MAFGLPTDKLHLFTLRAYLVVSVEHTETRSAHTFFLKRSEGAFLSCFACDLLRVEFLCHTACD